MSIAAFLYDASELHGGPSSSADLSNLPTHTVTATSHADATTSACTPITVGSDVDATIQTLPPGVTAMQLNWIVVLHAAITSDGSPNPSVAWAVHGLKNGTA